MRTTFASLLLAALGLGAVNALPSTRVETNKIVRRVDADGEWGVFSTFYNSTSSQWYTVPTDSEEAELGRHLLTTGAEKWPESDLTEEETLAALKRMFPDNEDGSVLAARGTDTNCKGSGLCKTCAGSLRGIRNKMCQGNCRYGPPGIHIRTDCNAFGQGLALFANFDWDEEPIQSDVDDMLNSGCKKCGSTHSQFRRGSVTNYNDRVTVNYVGQC